MVVDIHLSYFDWDIVRNQIFTCQHGEVNNVFNIFVDKYQFKKQLLVCVFILWIIITNQTIKKQ